jgi:hypothetical protein
MMITVHLPDRRTFQVCLNQQASVADIIEQLCRKWCISPAIVWGVYIAARNERILLLRELSLGEQAPEVNDIEMRQLYFPLVRSTKCFSPISLYLAHYRSKCFDKELGTSPGDQQILRRMQWFISRDPFLNLLADINQQETEFLTFARFLDYGTTMLTVRVAIATEDLLFAPFKIQNLYIRREGISISDNSNLEMNRPFQTLSTIGLEGCDVLCTFQQNEKWLITSHRATEIVSLMRFFMRKIPIFPHPKGIMTSVAMQQSIPELHMITSPKGRYIPPDVAVIMVTKAITGVARAMRAHVAGQIDDKYAENELVIGSLLGQLAEYSRDQGIAQAARNALNASKFVNVPASISAPLQSFAELERALRALNSQIPKISQSNYAKNLENLHQMTNQRVQARQIAQARPARGDMAQTSSCALVVPQITRVRQQSRANIAAALANQARKPISGITDDPVVHNQQSSLDDESSNRSHIMPSCQSQDQTMQNQIHTAESQPDALQQPTSKPIQTCLDTSQVQPANSQHSTIDQQSSQEKLQQVQIPSQEPAPKQVLQNQSSDHQLQQIPTEMPESRKAIQRQSSDDENRPKHMPKRQNKQVSHREISDEDAQPAQLVTSAKKPHHHRVISDDEDDELSRQRQRRKRHRHQYSSDEEMQDTRLQKHSRRPNRLSESRRSSSNEYHHYHINQSQLVLRPPEPLQQQTIIQQQQQPCYYGQLQPQLPPPLLPYQQIQPPCPPMYYPGPVPYPWMQPQQPLTSPNQITQAPVINVTVNSPAQQIPPKDEPPSQKLPPPPPQPEPQPQPEPALKEITLPILSKLVDQNPEMDVGDVLSEIETKIDEAAEQIRSRRIPLMLFAQIKVLAEKVQVFAERDTDPEISHLMNDLFQQLKHLSDWGPDSLNDKFETKANQIFDIIQQVHDKKRIQNCRFKRDRMNVTTGQTDVSGNGHDHEIMDQLQKLQDSLQQARLESAIAPFI